MVSGGDRLGMQKREERRVVVVVMVVINGTKDRLSFTVGLGGLL